MIQRILQTADEVAVSAGVEAAKVIKQAIAERGEARVVAATGNSQRSFLKHLLAHGGIDWRCVTLFHLDEYVGLAPEHPASMHRYIQDRLLEPAGIEHAYLLDGSRSETWTRAAAAVVQAPVDITFAGIGENGHVAFNEPPADLTTDEPFIVVTLAEQTRLRQVATGDFSCLADVPREAITMSVPQILKSRAILCIATGASKARAVKQCFGMGASPMAPASAPQQHPAATIYLDAQAAGLLKFES